MAEAEAVPSLAILPLRCLKLRMLRWVSQVSKREQRQLHLQLHMPQIPRQRPSRRADPRDPRRRSLLRSRSNVFEAQGLSCQVVLLAVLLILRLPRVCILIWLIESILQLLASFLWVALSAAPSQAEEVLFKASSGAALSFKKAMLPPAEPLPKRRRKAPLRRQNRLQHPRQALCLRKEVHR